MFKCFICSITFRASEFLTNHIKNSHSEVKEYECKQLGCVRIYGDLSSFKKHLDICYLRPTVSVVEKYDCPDVDVEKYDHPDVDMEKYDRPDVDMESQVINLPGDDNPGNNVNLENDNVQTSGNDLTKRHSFSADLYNAVLMYIGSLYSINSVPRSLVQSIIEMHQNLLRSGFLTTLQKTVVSALNNKSSSQDISSDTEKIIGMFSEINNMFDGLDTEYVRFQTFQECGAYIAPQPYNIVTANNEKEIDNNVIIEPIMLTGNFVPMKDCLKGFLELPNVLSSILKYMDSLASETNVIENVVQGDLWKNHILPKFPGKIVLPLTFYFDEYDPDNTLGSHAGIHKMGNGLYEISCMPPEFQSCLENKFLAIIFHASDRNAGNHEAFRPLLNMLRSLEADGVTVVTDGIVYQIYFALTLVIGDNLGLHGILGFVESFTANFPCIICRAPQRVVQTQLCQDDSCLRNRENYDIDVGMADESATGIKEGCMFHCLCCYHVTENVYVDMMHDVAEGAFNYGMCRIIHCCVRKLYFDYNVLNDRVQGFFYGFAELGNKPPIILQDYVEKENLKMSASELLCFVRYFGLMVGDLVPVDEPVWDFYKCMLSILDILFAPSISMVDIKILKSLISSHHAMYQELFHQTLKPKHHFLIHYPYVIQRIGPLCRVWCMRWESKHRESKQYAYVSCNRVDLPKSLSIKHQLKFCFRLVANRGFVLDVQTSVVDVTPLCKSIDFFLFAHVVPVAAHSNCKLKWVNVCGTKYHLGSVVIVGLSDYFPIFGIIQVIVYNAESKSINFVVKLLETVSFDDHFHAYNVKNWNKNFTEWKFVNQADLVTHLPSVLRKIGRETFVTCRHIL